MNQRQRAFCEDYLLSGNAAEAAREAGNSPRSARSIGQRLLTFDDVQEYLEQRNREISAANTAQMEEVRQFWTATMRDGNMKPSDRLKASELLAKTYGAFLERLEVDADLKTREIMAAMTEEELRALAQLGGEPWE